jgi:hypothetical protein
MSDVSSIIAKPNRFQWYCLTALGLALLGAIFHPVTVVVSVLTHWYCRRNERLKIFMWGCGCFSLVWYIYYHPIYFLDPSQGSSDFFLAIPFVAGMLQPLGMVQSLLRPRSVEEWFREAAQHRRIEKMRQLVAAEQIEKRPIPRQSGVIRLGVFLEGETFPAQSGICVQEQWLCLNTQVRAGHNLALGMTRSGKTETQKRYLFEAAMNTNADIYLIDGKAEEGLTQFFRNTCYASGRGNPPILRLGDKGRTHPYNGFNGSAEAIYNRLVEISKMGKAQGGARFYAQMDRSILLPVCKSVHHGPPRSFLEIIQRIDETWLQDECRSNPVARSVLKGVKAGDLITLKRSLYTFYEEFRYAMHPQGFSFDNSRCAIFSLPASSQKDSGKRFLDFLIEDFKDFTLRKDPERRVILMVDELNALGSDNMADLLKQCQSKNTTVFISIQDTASLGKSGQIQDLLANIDVYYLLQSNFPELIAAIAGTQDSVEPTIQYDTGEATGLGSIRKQDQFRVHPNDVRELSTGEAFVIQGNKAARIKVARVKEGELPVESLPPEDVPELREPMFRQVPRLKTTQTPQAKPDDKAAISPPAKTKKAPAQKAVTKQPVRPGVPRKPLPLSI